ncbi:hypothetical protein ACMSEJ_18605 [Bacteroides thetaiotaomicron]|uniref:hypothetical protein n=1 Tax=Bacteroides thetaiotaomicron TaxID=818 RepID=UPI0039C4B074
MSKKCLKCGCDLSNDNILYCPKCCDELYKPHKQEVVDKEDITRRAEAILSLIAQAILIVGIIASIILLLVGAYMLLNVSEHNKELGMLLLIYILYILPISITTWGVLNVVCNISYNLYAINKKMK